MFKDLKKDTDAKQAETVIGASVKVKGNFHGDGDIIIKGEVEGNVKTKNFLLVDKSAKVSADVSAKDACIGGKISGNIKVSDYLEIKSSARISGDIHAKELSIEKGAILNGQCHMGDNQRKESEHKNP
ncbi:polymer-forming cytoskeletal protein [Candidatus Parcubacteria bacterium]|nr:polymer-forming cytoskeletal protein [Candidatus Parcubacteria bacterium]